MCQECKHTIPWKPLNPKINAFYREIEENLDDAIIHLQELKNAIELALKKIP